MSANSQEIDARRGARSPRIAAARRRADLADRIATVLMSAAALVLVLVLVGEIGRAHV